MNARGISAIILGWWVVSQVLLGGALDRIGVFGGSGGGSHAQTPGQLKSKGLVGPRAKGRKSPPTSGPGAKLFWVQGSDGLWYPGTPKLGQQKALGPPQLVKP